MISFSLCFIIHLSTTTTILTVNDALDSVLLFLIKQDPQDHVITEMALELQKAELERKRQEKRLLEESLRASQVSLHKKEREWAMLMGKKQDMLAEEAAKEILLDDFMIFIEAIENNDPEIAQNFDENAMMERLLPMVNGDGGEGNGREGDGSDGGDSDGGEGDSSEGDDSDGGEGDGR